jgi:acyl-homoserine lactone synthase
MLHIVTQENIHLYQDEMRAAFQLRHRVFVEEMKWTDLDRGDGLEIDQFDTASAVHMLFLDEGSQVLGYQRMLPSTEPHLLSDVLAELCDGERPVGPNIWEWTRYAVDPAHRDRGRVLSPIGIGLLTGIVEWGLARGIDNIIIQMNPLWLLRLVQLHFRVTPLGFPKLIGASDTIAVTAAFNALTLARLNEFRGSEASVLDCGRQPKRVAGKP